MEGENDKDGIGVGTGYGLLLGRFKVDGEGVNHWDGKGLGTLLGEKLGTCNTVGEGDVNSVGAGVGGLMGEAEHLAPMDSVTEIKVTVTSFSGYLSPHLGVTHVKLLVANGIDAADDTPLLFSSSVVVKLQKWFDEVSSPEAENVILSPPAAPYWANEVAADQLAAKRKSSIVPTNLTTVLALVTKLTVTVS